MSYQLQTASSASTTVNSAEVTVAASAGFRDDFDSAASLDDGEISSAGATVVDGVCA